MKKLVLSLLIFSNATYSMALEQPINEAKEKPELTKLQKYGLIGLGAAAVVGLTIFGGVKRNRYLKANKPDDYGILPLSKAIDDVWAYANVKQESNKLAALEKVKKLLADGAKPNAINGCQTHLTRAVNHGLIDVASILLDYGATIDFSYESGDTALYGAVARKEKNIVRLLIDRGANPNLGSKYNGNALFKAIDTDESMAEYILGHSKVKIDINVRNIVTGDTLMIDACRCGYVGVVKKLIELNSDINAKNNKTNETSISVIEKNISLPWETYSALSQLLANAPRKATH